MHLRVMDITSESLIFSEYHAAKKMSVSEFYRLQTVIFNP